ncbi:hypothetical protein OCC_04792 [Thermococcus litoralis DSM 5473]|uniref:Uncharacterized protein n=1 Tax=Thermococcus litoralis (strain ATCC 51850 / DSM 5473 / JCM 8560 / NS-C) TaxID=523849 RepID=H3ZPV2_THELN|nr:hypothetical protein [Thermococcus litoralis]EHR78006.1 hypothetical protein OCC_04792 [Thermococcus litoralis DSM 5473]
MKKLLGLFLTFLGLLILLKSIRPEVYNYLLPYAPYIKKAFWGVVLIVAGLYVLIKNKTARTTLALVFILYLALFLVAPGSYYSWRFSFKDAGEIKTLGKFNSSEIVIENIAAEITVEHGTNGIEVLSNLPVKIEEGETLRISCAECGEYENGKLLVKVGDSKITSLALRNTVGDVKVDLGEISSLTLDNVVGDVTISGAFSSLVARNFIGDMEVELERCPENEEYCSQIGIYRGSGEINISPPAGTKVVPMIEGSLTSLTINKGFESGEKTLKLIVKNFIGKIVVE